MCRYTHSWDRHFKLHRLNIQASFPLHGSCLAWNDGRQTATSKHVRNRVYSSLKDIFHDQFFHAELVNHSPCMQISE